MLYEDQLEAATKFEEWLNNEDTLICGLWASAGFGKSFTVKHLIDAVVLGSSNYLPILTSMTHSAVDVLSAFTSMDVTTLHSLMGWVPMVDKDTGEEYLSTPSMRKKKGDKDPAGIPHNSIIIVDEAGLLGHEELKHLKQAASESFSRILLVGDHKQCFPVLPNGEELCIPAYDATECFLELTIPKRVDKTDMIYALSTAYRKTVDGERQPELRTMLNTDGSNKGVRVVDDIEEYAYMAFKAGVRDGDTTNIKVLAFTNNRCITLNRKIRKHILGLKDPTPIVGERMVANSAVQNFANDKIIMNNNQQVTVVKVEKTESHGLKGAFILFKNLDGEDIEETVFVPASPSKLRDRLKEIGKVAYDRKEVGDKAGSKEAWRAYFELKESVADIRFCYAMTVNKAQGITLKHALIDMCDINSARSREQASRLAYTAVTRATDYVTIEGELNDIY